MVVAMTEATVRYAETDQMGVVYHANYLVWMELGRTALVEKLGCDYMAMEKAGVVSPVLEVKVSYKKPLRYGDVAKIKTWIEKYDGFRVVYGYEITNVREELCAQATSLHVCVNLNTFKPMLMCQHFPEWHRVYSQAKKPE